MSNERVDNAAEFYTDYSGNKKPAGAGFFKLVTHVPDYFALCSFSAK